LSKRTISQIMLALLLTCMLTMTFRVQSVRTEPSTITVPDDYSTIQEAINAAMPGDTIYVHNGTYQENVVVNKTDLTLRGENPSTTIIDGKRIGNVLTITAENVNIAKFSIQNSSSTWLNDFGLYLCSTRHCTIENCVIKNNHFSVYLAYAHNNTVRNNTITNSYPYSVFIYSADNNTIIDNTIIDNESTGVEIEEGSKGNIIANNNISSNKYEGIYVIHSDSNIIVNNLLSFNGHGNPPLIYPGIKLMYSNNNTLAKNIILNNSGGIIVYFDWCSISACYNTIEYNFVENNDYGIILQYGGNQSNPSTATYNQVYENTLKSNGYGLYLIGVDNNTFYHNNFLGNTVAQVVAENSTNTWDNGCEGNYWSDYNGTDSDGDGIGDTPYFIDGNNTDCYPLMNLYWNPGDVDHDLDVDLYDAVKLLTAYGSKLGDEEYSPQCDIAEPYGKINLYDAVLLLANYGKKYS
jgi:parallel beta-helix repeat protein